MTSFIETQFPVSKLSKESYKERKANYSQTLTGLGKWWGRKPLIMVRAAILGLLLPAGQDPKRDREIFLMLLTMDPEGLWRRKTKAIPLAELFARLRPDERDDWFDPDARKPKYRPGTTAEDKSRLQRLVFERMGYDEKLVYCDRPEQIEGPSESAWAEINAHLGTDARSLPELVRALGEHRFGHVPRVGDAFCGGGSVPFEAARIGCEAYGSDLNPVAALLTWGALNIVGGGEAVAKQVWEAQEQVYAAVDRQITDWRIEHNDLGWRADAYLYCTETRCPECGWMVPLAPSWVIGEKTMTVARLVPSPASLSGGGRTANSSSPPPLAGGGRGEGEQPLGGHDALSPGAAFAPPPQPSPARGEGAFAPAGLAGKGRTADSSSPPPLAGGGRGEGEQPLGGHAALSLGAALAPPPQPSPARGEGACAPDGLAGESRTANSSSPPPLAGGGRGEGEQPLGGHHALSLGAAVAPSPQPSPARGEGAFGIEIHQGVSAAELKAAKTGTVRSSRLECPHCGQSTAMTAIRGDRRGGGASAYGLRQWDNSDLVPRPDDTFQERLYCIRWRLPELEALLWAEQHERAGLAADRPVPDWVPLGRAIDGLAAFLDASDRTDLKALRDRDWLAEDARLETAVAELAALRAAKAPKARIDAQNKVLIALITAQVERAADLKALADRLPGALYRAVEPDDLQREALVLSLLRERFEDLQAKGYIPSRRITPGDKTDEPIRTRGWTHWHHLFTPRQLLELGAMMLCAANSHGTTPLGLQLMLWVAKCSERNARIQGWDSSYTVEKASHVFTNQALNTQYVIGVNSHYGMRQVPFFTGVYQLAGSFSITVGDTRDVSVRNDLWLTDPPYADAIMYDELSEFFLGWYEKQAEEVFPEWYFDTKRALAIRGSGKPFREGMVDAYRNLAAHMPDNGMQIVMFTHQDAGVWADLALILWAAGLRVTAAWTIATETESALKEGNYVQGTVLMVLRKQTSDAVAFLDEIVPQVEIEVEHQLKSMLDLDDKEDPNFSDADYQLATYAAALRVLTQYKGIEDIDIAYELAREGKRGEMSPIARIIKDAVRTASNVLVPDGIDAQIWKRLTPEEKLYLKCLEVESHGDYRSGVFMEFARGFGVRDYRFMLESGKANQTRLKTATEFKRREWGTDGFGSSLLRHALFAVYQAADQESTKIGLSYLKTEIRDYWTRREILAEMIGFLGRLPMPPWAGDAEAARLLAGALANDHV